MTIATRVIPNAIISNVMRVKFDIPNMASRYLAVELSGRKYNAAINPATIEQPILRTSEIVPWITIRFLAIYDLTLCAASPSSPDGF
jgi:hypothetical protein